MDLEKAPIQGAYVGHCPPHLDVRGSFTKIFEAAHFAAAGFTLSPQEIYITVSCKHTLRGMHFQTPPHDHAKLVHRLAGDSLDVFIDLRPTSPSFDRHHALDLGATGTNLVLLPAGMAHVFLARQEGTCLLYAQSSAYSPVHDRGIHYSCFGYRWPGNPQEYVLSDRNQALPASGDLGAFFASP